MTPNRTDRNGMEGRLPSMSPLANPYVPFQLENPPKYEFEGKTEGTGRNVTQLSDLGQGPGPSLGRGRTEEGTRITGLAQLYGRCSPN